MSIGSSSGPRPLKAPGYPVVPFIGLHIFLFNSKVPLTAQNVCEYLDQLEVCKLRETIDETCQDYSFFSQDFPLAKKLLARENYSLVIYKNIKELGYSYIRLIKRSGGRFNRIYCYDLRKVYSEDAAYNDLENKFINK